MKHITYPHIVNSFVGSYIRRNAENVAIAQVEEKIDGSNFCFITNGQNVNVARRNEIINPEENFYGYLKLHHDGCNDIEVAKAAVKKVYSELFGELKSTVLYIYGELFPTQIRIKYTQSDKMYFIVFDVYADTEKLSRNIWAPILAKHKFLINPVLFEGSLQDCLSFEVENRSSIIPELLGETHKVEIEGVVIKSGNFMVKKKAQAFRETEHGPRRVKNNGVPTDAELVSELLDSMLTESRLNNIVSQIGDNMVPDAPRLANTVVLDAINEARDDEDCVIHKLSKSKIGKIQKELTAIFTPTVATKMKW